MRGIIPCAPNRRLSTRLSKERKRPKLSVARYTSYTGIYNRIYALKHFTASSAPGYIPNSYPVPFLARVDSTNRWPIVPQHRVHGDPRGVARCRFDRNLPKRVSFEMVGTHTSTRKRVLIWPSPSYSMATCTSGFAGVGTGGASGDRYRSNDACRT